MADSNMELIIDKKDLQRLLNKLNAIAKDDVIRKVLFRGVLSLASWSKQHRFIEGNTGPALPSILSNRTRRLMTSITARETIKEDNIYTAKYGTNVIYGRIHEFGGAIIPPRPFLTPAIREESNKQAILNDFVESINKSISEAK